jgi:putative heme degradation protein
MLQEDKLGAVKSLQIFGLQGEALEKLQKATEQETREKIVDRWLT